MRISLVAGASTLALASPAFAQQTQEPPAVPESKPAISNKLAGSNTPLVETAVPGDSREASITTKATSDAILERLNMLETRVNELETENSQLRQQAELNEGRLETVETRAAKAAQFSFVPMISEPTGNFAFKPRGVVDVDAAVFHERDGGYDYNDGTAFRRARLGFEGTAFKWFNYRLEVDFAGDAVNITDAYLQYTKIPKTAVTIGQHKAPFGLESNNSDNYNIFLERGMFTNAFGNAGAERRIGISVAYAPKENLNVAAGLFGDNESISRSATSPVTNTPDESWGINARATWEPVLQEGKIIHLGVSSYYRSSLKSGDVPNAVRLTDKPNVRVDNGNIADSGLITDVNSLKYGGLEAAGVLGRLTVAGEAGRLWLDRAGSKSAHFTGYYAYAAYMLTGETRPFKGGNFDRIRPFQNLGDGGFGAFEAALRYDRLDLSNTPVPARIGNTASSITAGFNWYFNPYAKVMFNWVRFWGDNSPLDPIGSKTRGDAFATRLHLDF